MWGGPLSEGRFVVVVVNRLYVDKQIVMSWAEDAMIPPGKYSVQVGNLIIFLNRENQDI